MILRKLSQAQLQDAIGTELLGRLETLAPVLLPNLGDTTELYKKSNLLKVLSAFAPAKLMKDVGFRRALLDAVESSTLDALLTATGTARSGASFEARREALVARGWKDLAFCRAFLEAAALPETFLPSKVPSVPDVSLVPSSEIPYKRLKDYQVSVFVRANEALVPQLARVVLQMPTGSGKTRTAMEIVCDALNEKGPGRVVVWMAHAEELCEQAIACFNQVWVHVGRCPARVVRLFGSHEQIGPPEEGPTFLVAGFQKVYSLRKKRETELEKLSQRVQLLVIDEAHKVIAATFDQAARALKGPSTRVLGLTATPGRTAKDAGENRALAEFFFGQIAEIQPPPGSTVIEHLRARGVLSRCRMERLRTSKSYSLSKTELLALEKELDYPQGFLSRLGADDVRNVELVRRLHALCSEGKQILFFSCSVEHSKFICALLVFLGVKANHVDGATLHQERAASIEAFREGSIQVLCNYGILSTGFDAPKTNVVFIARPTASIVLYSQMIGRGLRGPAIGGTEDCLVVNVLDNIVGLPGNEEIYEYFEDYWE